MRTCISVEYLRVGQTDSAGQPFGSCLRCRKALLGMNRGRRHDFGRSFGRHEKRNRRKEVGERLHSRRFIRRLEALATRCFEAATSHGRRAHLETSREFKRNAEFCFLQSFSEAVYNSLKYSDPIVAFRIFWTCSEGDRRARAPVSQKKI